MIDSVLRVVIDTNVLLSFLIKRSSTPGIVVTQVLQKHVLLTSTDVLYELHKKCKENKFRSYFSIEEGQQFIELLSQVGEHIIITKQIFICRDTCDNKFLELALSGGANFIVSGDKDLLEIKQFNNFKILSPSKAMELYFL